MSDELPQKNEPRITRMTRINKIPSAKSVVKNGGVEK
jgi:hypothetical protein